jgi:hypothetical protein
LLPGKDHPTDVMGVHMRTVRLTRRSTVASIVLSLLQRWPSGVLAAQAQSHSPALIFHQQPFGDTTSPADVAENMAYIESLPFDGITVVLSASAHLMQGDPISYGEMYDDGLAPLTGAFRRMRHNFVLAHIDYPGDVFDDSAWDTTTQNFRHLARATRDAGLRGIFFDNEAYNRQWTDYPEDYTNPQHSLREYQQQAHLRGRQIMEAMVDEYPEIELLIFHGPYLSEPKTPLYVRMNQAGSWIEHELHGPFFVGFLDGLGDRAKLIDGGEVYQYRTADDFRRSYDWRKFGMASPETDCAFLPEHLRAAWPERISISFGQATHPYAGEPMTPEIMRTSLANALRQADDYVWLYTEADTWMKPGGMPSKWEKAIGDAVKAAGGAGGEDDPRRRRRRRRKGRRRRGRRRK